MIKYYCDSCGDEINDDNRCAGGAIHCDNRFGGEVTTKNGIRLKIEILTSLDGVANQGAFCKKCVVQAVNQLAEPEPPKKLRSLRS